MSKPNLKSQQSPTDHEGGLKIDVTSSLGLIPIKNAKITITDFNDPDNVIDIVTTDESGQTQDIELETPPLQYSLETDETKPYAEYNILVEADGYEPTLVQGTQVLPDTIALQPVELYPLEVSHFSEESIFIPDHTLYGEYPPKIPEAEIKPIDESG